MDMSVKLNLSYPAPQQATTVADKPEHKPLTETAQVVAAKGEDKNEQVGQESLKIAVEKIDRFVQSVKRNLEFLIDDSSGKVVVKVIASDSGEVIRQIPNEEVLKLANRLNDASSLLFSAKV